MKAFTIICGPDDFLVSRRGREAWEKMSADITDDFGREIVDAQAGNLSEVDDAVHRFIGAVRTLPMFGDRKVVWLRNISFMGDARPGGTEGAKEAIAKIQSVLEELKDGNVDVLLTASPFSRRSKKQVEWWKKHGDYQFLEADNDGATLFGEMSREAESLGMRLSPDAGRLLLAKINGNTRLALEEVRKLATYVGEAGSEITDAHVAELVPTFGEGDFFEAAEAFYALDLNWTLDAIRRHFFAGYDGRPMITSLQNRNRLLIQLKVLQDARVLGDRISKPSLESAARRYAEHFGESSEKSGYNVFTQNPWYLGRLAEPLKRLTLKQLITFQGEFLGAFRGILDRPQEQEMVMRETAVRCLG